MKAIATPLSERAVRALAAGDVVEISGRVYTGRDKLHKYFADGGTLPVVFVYYDAYAGGVEFCFSLFAYDGDYESAQSLLDDIMQTVSLHVETQL